MVALWVRKGPVAPFLPTDMKPIGATSTLGGLDLATSYVELLANGLATIEDDLAVVRHNDGRVGPRASSPCLAAPTSEKTLEIHGDCCAVGSAEMGRPGDPLHLMNFPP